MDLEAYLKKTPTTKGQRAELWDAFQDSSNADDFAAKVQGFNVPKQIKADLWDMKADSGSSDDAAINAANSKYTVNPDQSGPAMRFIKGLASSLNPVTMAEGLGDMAGRGLAAIDRDGLPGALASGGRAMVDAQSRGFVNAWDLAGEGRTTEAFGQALSGALPVFGPMARNVGEEAAETGNLAGAFGQGVGIGVAPRVASKVPAAVRFVDGRMVKPITKGLKQAPAILQDVKAGMRSVEMPTYPEIVNRGVVASAVGALAGPEAAALAAGAMELRRVAPKVYKSIKDGIAARRGVSGAKAEESMLKMAPEELASVAEDLGIASKPIPAPAPDYKAAIEAGPRGNAAKRAMAEQRAASQPAPVEAPAPVPAPVPVAPEPAPVAPRPSQVPDVARDVDSALRSLPKATQARLKHVVKQAIKESPAPRLPQPDPSLVVAGRDPFKLGNRVYSSEPAATPRTRISEHYAINPNIALAEGATGVHPTLGLPMRADGKVLVRNVEEFSDTPGRAPRGAPVWRDPDARFGQNQTVNEVAGMLEARSSTSTSIADLQKQLEAATKREPAPGSYAADEAARTARQKQHIADSYAKKEANDAANVKQSESLIPDLEQSAELLKKYPKRGGESSIQWMKRVTKAMEPENNAKKAADIAATVLELHGNQGLSRAQIRAVLRENHGFPNDLASQAVNMILGEPK